MKCSRYFVILSGARQRGVEGSWLGSKTEISGPIRLLCQDSSTPLRFAQNDMLFAVRKKRGCCILQQSLSYVYYLPSLSKRVMIAAICSRVALPFGWKVPSGKPVTMPFATAQATAGLA